ncbi:cytoplasmic dynein 1 light intermediate chain 2-like [Artemia franciscana]|uniref:Dynein light intermediate chain n=1 Tax=Artemia franciscana TaxID=6661 RepID=A0AA88ILP1_ARTSF|nr:hypothetical protein QYM36_003280 [Artemia franciscana]
MAHKNGLDSRNKDDQPKENIWQSILSEVQLKGVNKLPSNKSICVLGDTESGKTTLIAKLQGVDDPKKGSGLEYTYIDVRDEYRDDHTQLSVWLLDGDPSHSHLLSYALNERTINDTMVMLTLAMTTPWAILDQLRSWATILQDQIDKLSISAETMRDLQNKCSRRWQNYIEPGDEIDNALAMRRSQRLNPNSGMTDSTEDLEQPPLPDGVLNRNLGVDLVVVVTKTDYMSTLEKEMEYKEEHFDFVQAAVRRFCIQYGAGLCYTSVKEDKNCDVLYKYIVHRMYGLPFKTPALVVEKDAVFIPSGWDNEKKIAILHENMVSVKPSDYYTDVITKPAVRKAAPREAEIQAEEEQKFLQRQLNILSQGANNQNQSPIGLSDGVGHPALPPSLRSAAVQKTPDRRISVGANTPGQILSPKKSDGVKPGVTSASEGVLANFFNSLLKKSSPAGNVSPLQNQDRMAIQAAGDAILGSRSSGPPSIGSLPENGVLHNADSALNNHSSQPESTSEC